MLIIINDTIKTFKTCVKVQILLMFLLFFLIVNFTISKINELVQNLLIYWLNIDIEKFWNNISLKINMGFGLLGFLDILNFLDFVLFFWLFALIALFFWLLKHFLVFRTCGTFLAFLAFWVFFALFAHPNNHQTPLAHLPGKQKVN